MISEKRVNDICPSIDIVALAGRLGLQSQEALTVELTQAIDDCSAGLLIDMSDVEFVSSSGLRALMFAYKHAETSRKKVVMMQVRPAVYKIFKLTGFHDIFRVFEDEAVALADFG